MPDSDRRRDGRAMTLWLGLTALVALLDQASKYVMLAWLAEGERVTVTFFFDFKLVYNPGAAFSFLGDQSGWQRWFFVVMTVLICAWLLRLIWQSRFERLVPAAFCLIVGGAVGNLVDRLLHGEVVDFLLFHLDRFAWPVFNLADTAITIGVALILWDMFRSGKHSRHLEKTS